MSRDELESLIESAENGLANMKRQLLTMDETEHSQLD